MVIFRMDYKGKPQPYSCLLIMLFLCVMVHLSVSQSFDSLTQKVTFYPTSLMISHSPLNFYDNTKLLNIHTILKFPDLGASFRMSNSSCSATREKFFDDL